MRVYTQITEKSEKSRVQKFENQVKIITVAIRYIFTNKQSMQQTHNLTAPSPRKIMHRNQIC